MEQNIHLLYERLKNTTKRVKEVNIKKIFKVLIIFLTVALTAWGGMFITDFYRSGHLMSPVFAICINDGGTPTYKGLGYTVSVKTDRNCECCGSHIISVTMYVGEKAVSASIT